MFLIRLLFPHIFHSTPLHSTPSPLINSANTRNNAPAVELSNADLPQTGPPVKRGQWFSNDKSDTPRMYTNAGKFGKLKHHGNTLAGLLRRISHRQRLSQSPGTELRYADATDADSTTMLHRFLGSGKGPIERRLPAKCSLCVGPKSFTVVVECRRKRRNCTPVNLSALFSTDPPTLPSAGLLSRTESDRWLTENGSSPLVSLSKPEASEKVRVVTEKVLKAMANAKPQTALSSKPHVATLQRHHLRRTQGLSAFLRCFGIVTAGGDPGLRIPLATTRDDGSTSMVRVSQLTGKRKRWMNAKKQRKLRELRASATPFPSLDEDTKTLTRHSIRRGELPVAVEAAYKALSKLKPATTIDVFKDNFRARMEHHEQLHRYNHCKQLAEARFLKAQKKLSVLATIGASIIGRRLSDAAGSDLPSKEDLVHFHHIGGNYQGQRRLTGHKVTSAAGVAIRGISSEALVSKLDEWGTSKTDPVCHRRLKFSKQGKVSTCPTCGTSHQRDAPASQNILDIGNMNLLFNRRPTHLTPSIRTRGIAFFRF